MVRKTENLFCDEMCRVSSKDNQLGLQLNYDYK